MSDAIIVALITGVLAVVGEIIVSAKNTRELYAKLDKQSEVSDAMMHGEINVIKEEVRTLREEVQKHNKVVERTYELEKNVARHDEQIKTLFNQR